MEVLSLHRFTFYTCWLCWKSTVSKRSTQEPCNAAPKDPQTHGCRARGKPCELVVLYEEGGHHASQQHQEEKEYFLLQCTAYIEA